LKVINSTKKGKELYNENCKPLKEEIKEVYGRWKVVLYS
jgi:hypothetical protein